MNILRKLTIKINKEKEFYEKVKNEKKALMLFGAGSAAVFILKRLIANKIKPVCFCDNNPAKQNKFYLGLPVLSFEEFKKRYKDSYYILITIAKMEEIYKYLIKKGENKKNIFYFTIFKDPWSEPTDYDFIKKNLKKFEIAYNLLSDKLSKKIFINLLKSKITGDYKYIKIIKSDKQYFDTSLIKFSDDEIYLDVGAYTGDSIKDFLKITQNQYKEIIAFEPDNKNFNLLNEFVISNNIKNIKLLKIGAWNKEGIVNFEKDLLGSSGITKKNFGGKKIKIKVDKIDNIVGNKKATFIKMDVEGAEYNALYGAKNIIKNYKPKLAISVYHKRQDLYDIILLIKKFVNEYKFYLRHYSDTNADTVLYAL